MEGAFTCRHELQPLGGVSVVACSECRIVEWWGQSKPLDAASGLARLFGSFELVGSLDGLGSPAARVLAYRPPGSDGAEILKAFPPRVWLSAAPGLWMSHDGEHLLLAPTDASVVRTFAG